MVPCHPDVALRRTGVLEHAGGAPASGWTGNLFLASDSSPAGGPSGANPATLMLPGRVPSGANPLGQHCDDVALGGSANSNAIEPPRAEDKNAKTHAFFNIEVGGTP